MWSEPVPLRPHHGMCLAYFVGEGYSGGFAVHMGQGLAALAPDTPVKLVVNTDEICTACPNNTGGTCEKPDLVADYDRQVLSRCGLTEGEVLPFGCFTALVEEKILSSGHRREICGGCQWNGLCDATASRWKKQPPEGR